MSFSTVISASIQGLKVELVNVEADVCNGLPAFHMVGYLSSEVKEAAERVRTAIKNSGFSYPPKRTVINLSPATIRKKGPAFDLPIAVSILVSLGEIRAKHVRETLIIGELGLDGTIHKVTGILPVVLAARDVGLTVCIVPKVNAAEGALVKGIRVIGVKNLKELHLFLSGKIKLKPEEYKSEQISAYPKVHVDFGDMKGQAVVKRGAEVAVAGGHNLLLVGPPGSGKSMAAKRISGILPPMTMEESMDITQIYSILGLIDSDSPLILQRPFRSVHHTATKAALIGGGLVPVPGEISLAHGGVLFLDELPEFQKTVLEVLREPLEERKIRIRRIHGNYIFPANFMLIGAMNPCPCGCYPNLERCTCTQTQIQQYLGKVSQPFLDRMDLCIETPKVRCELLIDGRREEESFKIRDRVIQARKIQNKRYEKLKINTNSMMGINELERYCSLGKEEKALIKQAFTSLGITARVYHKILKVSRTIADLDGDEVIGVKHIKEAIGYRTIDKKYWGK